ncbi:ribosome maturation factor RimM [Spiroplasma turonicum]|uniref:16S rRNA processing protein rimM n=1 Tax=Spiroplasma turonicum TaxID=216946 RepID=A0A0K1P787_9MOLU|nr:hypothetical protein [Spiroplasma turonicum]AKU80059.1 16S rRNA processing protein rimM [Spiroplasma turonicum]ALX71061.1 16S rRNA processing protein rimM [Spiroplasma turonicum]
MENKLKKIGNITSTFGIKGWLKFNIVKDLELSLDIVDEVFFLKNGEFFEPFKVMDYRIKNNNFIISFENINNIDIASKMINKEVFIKKESLVFIEKLNYLNYNVSYLNVAYEIVDCINNGFYWIVKINFNKNNIWIPLVDEYIIDINDKDKVIYVKNIERLDV